MATKARWLFVDDQSDEAVAIAARLSGSTAAIEIEYRTPLAFREEVLTQNKPIDGALLDVNLASIKGEHGTGPGIAQDIRIKQRSGNVREFPVVRFSSRDQIRRNIGGDPGSDDLFDLKISKEEAGRGDEASIVQCLLGLNELYSILGKIKLATESDVTRLLGLDDAQAESWSDWSLHSKIRVSAATADHVAAGVIMRDLLNQPGPLITEAILSYRLGVDRLKSAKVWDELLNHLDDVRFKGPAAKYFPRWWARGVDDWWLVTASDAQSLAFTNIAERTHRITKRYALKGLVPLTMPKGSAGQRPWSPCILSAEQDPPIHIPLDPDESVRFAPIQYIAPWIDPTFAALAPALQDKNNPRLNSMDLARLIKKHGI